MPVEWTCFPITRRPPPTVGEVAAVFEAAAAAVDSRVQETRTLSSGAVLAEVRAGLLSLGFDVEDRGHPVWLPVLYGDGGRPRRRFRADAWHEDEGVVVEVEAGGARQINRALLDILKGLVWSECRHLIVAVKHSYGSGEQDDYGWLRDWVELLYASDRIKLPFQSLTVIGY